MPITTLSLAVVGADHPNKGGPTRRFAIRLCRPGDPVHLNREPKNPADPQAVRVLDASGVMMGYITAERAPWIGGMLAAGRALKAVFQEPTPYGALIRVTLDGSEPALPRTMPRSSRDQEWWPDELPPDD